MPDDSAAAAGSGKLSGDSPEKPPSASGVGGPPSGTPPPDLPATPPADQPPPPDDGSTKISPGAVTIESGPKSVDLQSAQVVTPAQAPVAKLPPLDKAGVDLAKWVLVMISVFVFISIIWVWRSESTFSEQFGKLTAPPPPQISGAGTNGVSGFSTNNINTELLEIVIKARTEFRDFWLKIFQTVLLNVLLPVLTALLGYVFGSRRTVANPGKE